MNEVRVRKRRNGTSEMRKAEGIDRKNKQDNIKKIRLKITVKLV